jgi:hypothetical protein
MNQAEKEMDEAIEAWLDSSEGFERHIAATERLYAVFARSWQGSRRCLSEAFTDFREAILRDSGNKHPEVTMVFPMRRPESE